MIRILDCTLRDGGYVNNWEFGENTIFKIISNLSDAQIDVIECGFISTVKECKVGKSIFANTNEIGIEKKNPKSKLAVMINYGEFDEKKLVMKLYSNIDIIRVAFHKKDFFNAVEYCNKCAEKGYEVYLQPMNSLNYSDSEFEMLINLANQSQVSAFYLVDTLGNMTKQDLEHYYGLIVKNLRKDIVVGFHSHNNLQLSFSNAQTLISICDRELILDSSLYGMGRGAGNLCSELLTQYLNDNLGKRYDILPILECIDECIMPIYLQHAWGYSVPYYLAAANNCHPNYATNLVNRQTLHVRDINNIIKSIPSNKKAVFDETIVNNLYLQYQQRQVNDSQTLKMLQTLCEGRKILILAPGKNIRLEKETICEFIKKNDPIVFSVNHLPMKEFKCDKIFVSNMKRFKSEKDMLKLKDKLICTSNICVDDKISVLNYTSYLNEEDIISDNSGLILINVFIKIGIKEIFLAGYDGFSFADDSNYFDDIIINNNEYENRNLINKAMMRYFERVPQETQINFITRSLYCGDKI